MNILLVDHHKTTQKVVKQLFKDDVVSVAYDANSAVEIANENSPDLVILELSLAVHSGMEFLYEFRTYSDWKNVPVIIYTTLRLESDVLNSTTWKQLGIDNYIYKPESSLEQLKDAVEKIVK